jgi:hypothetical protein
MPDVTLGKYNTVAVTAAAGVYWLKSATGLTMTVNLLNVGPGSIYVREPQAPAVGAADSLPLPANFYLNGLTFDGAIGLGVIAEADTMLGVKAV